MALATIVWNSFTSPCLLFTYCFFIDITYWYHMISLLEKGGWNNWIPTEHSSVFAHVYLHQGLHLVVSWLTLLRPVVLRLTVPAFLARSWSSLSRCCLARSRAAQTVRTKACSPKTSSCCLGWQTPWDIDVASSWYMNAIKIPTSHGDLLLHCRWKNRQNMAIGQSVLHQGARQKKTSTMNPMTPPEMKAILVGRWRSLVCHSVAILNHLLSHQPSIIKIMAVSSGGGSRLVQNCPRMRVRFVQVQGSEHKPRHTWRSKVLNSQGLSLCQIAQQHTTAASNQVIIGFQLVTSPPASRWPHNLHMVRTALE